MAIVPALLGVLLVVMVFVGAATGTAEKLATDLLHDPISLFEPPGQVQVNFGAGLIWTRWNPEDEILTAKLWLRYSWKDSRLIWDPTSYGGIEEFRAPADMLWKPDVVLYNSVDDFDIKGIAATKIIIYSDGTVLWLPPTTVQVYCPRDISTQTCEAKLRFGSWAMHDNQLSLGAYTGKTELDMTYYVAHKDAEVVDSYGQFHTETYPCCPNQPFKYLDFKLKMKLGAQSQVKGWSGVQ